jgi:hypothetical protein
MCKGSISKRGAYRGYAAWRKFSKGSKKGIRGLFTYRIQVRVHI